jgi:hypothetical protein
MRVHAIASIVNGGTPTYLFGSSAFDQSTAIVDTATGNMQLTLMADRGIGSGVILASPRVAGAASANREIGPAHTSATVKQLTTLQEGGSGAAGALADYAYDVAILGDDAAADGVIVGAGSIAFSGGTPSHTFQSGLLEAVIVDTGAGNISVDFVADRSFDASECIILATPRIAATASNNRSIGVIHTTDVRKQFTLLEEGSTGAASALADFAFDWVILATRRSMVRGVDPRRLPRLHALGHVVNGGAASLTYQAGATSSVNRAGAGDVDLTLTADGGVDAGECAIIATPHGSVTASTMRSIGVVHTSDTEKQFTSVAEASSGGASVAADTNFDFAIIRAA